MGYTLASLLSRARGAQAKLRRAAAAAEAAYPGEPTSPVSSSFFSFYFFLLEQRRPFCSLAAGILIILFRKKPFLSLRAIEGPRSVTFPETRSATGFNFSDFTRKVIKGSLVPCQEEISPKLKINTLRVMTREQSLVCLSDLRSWTDSPRCSRQPINRQESLKRVRRPNDRSEDRALDIFQF